MADIADPSCKDGWRGGDLGNLVSSQTRRRRIRRRAVATDSVRRGRRRRRRRPGQPLAHPHTHPTSSKLRGGLHVRPPWPTSPPRATARPVHNRPTALSRTLPITDTSLRGPPPPAPRVRSPCCAYCCHFLPPCCLLSAYTRSLRFHLPYPPLPSPPWPLRVCQPHRPRGPPLPPPACGCRARKCLPPCGVPSPAALPPPLPPPPRRPYRPDLHGRCRQRRRALPQPRPPCPR